MKKFITLMLAALMLFGTCASADTQTIACIGDTFAVVLDCESNPAVVMEVNEHESDGMDIVRAAIADEGAATVHISVALSDLADGMSLNEMGDEGIAILSEMAAEQYDEAVISTEVTPSGNTFISIASPENEVVSIFTIYKGYFIEMVQYNDSFAPLTEADGAFLHEVLEGLWVVDLAA